MTLGIICTVVIGLIALHQAWRARLYQAQALRAAGICEQQRVAMDHLARKFERGARTWFALAEGIIGAQQAIRAEDARGLLQALNGALARAQAIQDEDQPPGERCADGVSAATSTASPG